MSDAKPSWDGIPPNPTHTGHHWLRHNSGDLSPWKWTDENNAPGEFEWSTDDGTDPDEMARQFSWAGHCEPSVAENNTPGVGDEELIRRAMRCGQLKPNSRHGTLRWIVIMDRFIVGSTYAQALCERFGFDPDERVRR